MSSTMLRVGLDLDGSLESMTNSMFDLATALDERGDLELLRFRTLTPRQSSAEARLPLRKLWSPWWRHSRGRAIDTILPSLDVVHVAGAATPPTNKVPLLISVDDLRPLREEHARPRVIQLQRAVSRGAILVVSSRVARHEVRATLGLDRPEIVVVRPPVGRVAPTRHGTELVVNLTGNTEHFLTLAQGFAAFVEHRHVALIVVASSAAAQRLRSQGVDAQFVERHLAAEALSRARCVVSISDGARFPSFALAALAAGVPTLLRDTAINRELVGGAATLIGDDDQMVDALAELWSNEARRAILVAAGHARAADFSPWNVASAYAALYADVAKRRRA